LPFFLQFLLSEQLLGHSVFAFLDLLLPPPSAKATPDISINPNAAKNIFFILSDFYLENDLRKN
jgi:hypothetical protein